MKKLFLLLLLVFLLSMLVSCTNATTTINSLASNSHNLKYEELNLDSVSQLIQDFVEVYEDKKCFSYFVDPIDEEITVVIFTGSDTKDPMFINLTDIKELKDKTVEITVENIENSKDKNNLSTYKIVKFKPSLQIPKIIVKDNNGEIYSFFNKLN